MPTSRTWRHAALMGATIAVFAGAPSSAGAAPRAVGVTPIDGGGVGTGAPSSGVTPVGTVAPLAPGPLPEAPAPAPEGTFHLWGCRTPAGAPAPTDGWIRLTDASPASVVRPQFADCAEGGSLALAAGAGTSIPNDLLAFSPGRGLRLLDGHLWRSARAALDNAPSPVFPASILTVNAEHPIPADQFAVSGPIAMGAVADAVATAGALGGTQAASEVVVKGTASEPLAPANRVWLGAFDGTMQAKGLIPLQVSSSCFSLSGTGSCEVRYRLWASDLRIVDADPPSVTSLSGDLIGEGRTLRPSVAGLTSVTVGGSDSGTGGAIGTGIRRAVIEVDGAPAASASPELSAAELAECTPARAADGRPAFTRRRPCPASGPIAIRWNTADVSDGRHAVRILLEDAVGHVTIASSGSVVVRNASAIGAGSPLELRGEPNGSPSADSAVLRVSWPTTARRASAKPATVRRCKGAAYAKRHPLQCAGRPAISGAAFDWASKPLTGQLELIHPDGRPIVGAAVRLSASPMAAGAGPLTLDTVTTDAAGRAAFSVSLADGSRTIEARWSARTLDTRPAAIGTATITIRSSTSLSAPRQVRPGGRVTFKGRLDGRAGSLAKVPVQLEVRDGGRWKTFATAATDGAGMWSTSLRFARTPGRYTVRARVGTTTTYPYADGSGQRPITIAVR